MVAERGITLSSTQTVCAQRRTHSSRFGFGN
jgi:hypothetical protein